MSTIEVYRCNVCGNMVVKVRNGGGELVCCGQPMQKLDANTTDAAVEKHVPAITRENGKIKAAVGSVPHPMLPEHHIEWIALVAGEKVQFAFLKPGEEAKAEFNDPGNGTVFEYCNLHGLWKAEF